LALNNNEDQLFITDQMNHRVQLFTPAGQFISIFGNITSSPYQLRFPTGICYTFDGHEMISSWGSTDCVLIFSEDGNYVSAIKGAYQKEQRFIKPIGVVMRSNGQIVIASDISTGNNLTVF